MALLDSFVEWFNGLLGLQYAGYGPITALLIGIAAVFASIHVFRFFLKPFAPLFQTAQALGEANPVLERKGIRQSQLAEDFDDEADMVFNRRRHRTPEPFSPAMIAQPAATRRRKKELLETSASRFDELCDMDLDDTDNTEDDAEAVLAAFKSNLPKQKPELDTDFDTSDGDDENIKPIKNFSEELDAAFNEDARAPRAPARLARPAPRLTLVSDKSPLSRALHNQAKRPATASAVPTAAAKPSGQASMPFIQVSSFGEPGAPQTAANRLAHRLGEGVTETLARVPNLAVERCRDGNPTEAPGFGPRFVVEGGINVQGDGVLAAITVRSVADGLEVLRRDMVCKPSELARFEKEVALEIAAAVIAHQQSSGASVSQHLQGPKAARSGSTYPSAARPSPERLHRTDLQVQ